MMKELCEYCKVKPKARLGKRFCSYKCALNFARPIRWHFTVEERFWQKVEKTDKCWLWLVARSTSGHGNFFYNKKVNKAHRFSYELHSGKIKEGNEICHHCDNPPCVNPSHLFQGTHKDNMIDAKSKNRMIGQKGEANYGAKLTIKKVCLIRKEHIPYKFTTKMLANKYNVHPCTIERILYEETWKK